MLLSTAEASPKTKDHFYQILFLNLAPVKIIAMILKGILTVYCNIYDHMTNMPVINFKYWHDVSRKCPIHSANLKVL